MILYSRRMVAASKATVPLGEVVGTADQRVILHNVPWSHYEVMLALRGESSVPRLSYCEGTLEIMSPSRTHEHLKSRIGHLVEVFLLHHDIEFEAVGSWTLKGAPELRGAEPDECYLLGEDRSGDRPHLAIEVSWTSGGIDKLAIYARLGVPEVWIWKDGIISAHVLGGQAYEQRTESAVLSDINLAELTEFLDAPSASAAIKAYRKRLEG